MNKMDYDWENDPVIKGLVETLKRAPKSNAKMLNFPVFANMIAAKIGLDMLLQESGGDGIVRIELSSNFSCGSVKVDMDSLEVYKPQLFAAATELADNFEVYALANGKIRLALMFYDAFTPVA